MSKNIRKMMANAAPGPDSAKKDAFIRMYREKSERTELSVFDMIKSLIYKPACLACFCRSTPRGNLRA